VCVCVCWGGGVDVGGGGDESGGGVHAGVGESRKAPSAHACSCMCRGTCVI
jgi:hypothetical protein